ncbi:putative N6-adenine methyltransferase-domain-containing protein [Usnea florida]
MGGVEENDDEELELPVDTLTALHEFYSERESKEKRFQDLKRQIEQKPSQTQLSMDMFSEDWNASQFWYSDETAATLARQLLQGSTADTTNICIVSAPSVFLQLKNLIASDEYQASSICLLEFDHRFSVFQEFIHYDFEHPLGLPVDMKGKYDRILCDPPFLSADCQTKAATTVRWLSKPASPETGKASPRIIVCTGERMEDLVLRLYPGITTTTFDPQHCQNRLSNAFRCYASFEGEAWSWRKGP